MDDARMKKENEKKMRLAQEIEDEMKIKVQLSELDSEFQNEKNPNKPKKNQN